MQYNIVEYGARGDGIANDAGAIQRTIDACAVSGGGRVVIPGGKVFLSGSIVLKSNVDLHIESGAVLKASGKAEDFASTSPESGIGHEGKRDVPSYVNCEYDGKPRSYFIYAKDATFVTISGPGKIDGNGEVYYGDSTPYHIEGKYYPRIPLLLLENVSRLTIRDVAMTNCGFWTLHMVGCSDVLVDGIRILNSLMMANCDGIDPDHCRNVRIVNCHIECADDCIVLKNTKGYEGYGACENIVISGCTLVSTSAAIKIGTESENDFRNIVVSDCVISGSNRGVSLQLRDRGNIENVSISNMIIETRRFSHEWWGQAEPICITCLDRKPGVKAGHIRNVRFSNITCVSENGILIHGSRDNYIEDVSFERVTLNLRKISKWPADGYDLRPCGDEGLLKTDLHSVYCRYARGISLHNLSVAVDESMKPYVRPDGFTVDCENVSGLS